VRDADAEHPARQDNKSGRIPAAALTVTPVNDAPTLTVAGGGSCGANDRSGTINLTVLDVDNAAGP
jgi:hypothetical protein